MDVSFYSFLPLKAKKKLFCLNGLPAIKNISVELSNHHRHGLLSFLSSLPISVLRNLASEANKLYNKANKLYNAALLTRRYVQHFLVLISILGSTINDILSKFHSLTQVWSLSIFKVSLKIYQ